MVKNIIDNTSTTFTTENRFKEYDIIADHQSSGRNVGPGSYTTINANIRKIKGASKFHRLMSIHDDWNSTDYSYFGFRLMRHLQSAK